MVLCSLKSRVHDILRSSLIELIRATADIYQYIEPSFQSFTQEMKILSDFIECIGDNQNRKIHDGKKKKKNNQ